MKTVQKIYNERKRTSVEILDEWGTAIRGMENSPICGQTTNRPQWHFWNFIAQNCDRELRSH
jgi:hypothetical protein